MSEKQELREALKNLLYVFPGAEEMLKIMAVFPDAFEGIASATAVQKAAWLLKEIE